MTETWAAAVGPQYAAWSPAVVGNGNPTPTSAPSAAGLTPEQLALAQKYGIDPSTLIGPATSTQQLSKDELPVYWAQTPGAIKESGHGVYQEPSRGSGQKTVAQANAWLQDVFVHNKPKWDRIVNQMISVGLITGQESDLPGAVMANWASIVDRTAMLGVDSHVSPEDYLSLYAERNPTAPGTPTDNITTSTSTNVSSASEVAGQVDPFAQGLLGREATAGEQAAALSAVQAGDRANPSTTTTTTHSGKQTKGTSRTTQSSTTTGGFDPTHTLRQQFLNAPDFAAFDAAAKLLPALEAALGATVRTGTNGTPSL